MNISFLIHITFVFLGPVPDVTNKTPSNSPFHRTLPEVFWIFIPINLHKLLEGTQALGMIGHRP